MADTHRIINKGTQDEILELQRFLNAFQFTDNSGASLKFSGKFDTQTKEALINFQKEAGIDSDGLAGKNTVTAMIEYADKNDIPAKQEPQAEPVSPAVSTASLGDANAAITPRVAEPIKTAPKLGDKPQRQQTTDPAAAKRMAAIKAMQAKRAAQKSAQGATPTPAFDDNRATPQARPVKTPQAPEAPPQDTQQRPGFATPVVTPRPVEQPAADTEMRPVEPKRQEIPKKSAEEPQVSTDPATIYNKGEEKVPPPPPSPNQMAIDDTSKALDTWLQSYQQIKTKDYQPVKTFGSLLKNLKDIYSNGQKAIKSDPQLKARWKKIVADVTQYHSNPEGKRQVNEAQALADGMLQEGLFDKFTDLFKPTKSEPGQATDRRSRQKRKEKPASTSVPNMAGRRTNIRKTLDKSQNVEQDKITSKVVTLVSDKIKSLGYDPNDMPGNPELKKAYQDIGKTIESIQAIVKQYQQKGAHADLVNIKEQFSTLQSQLETYAKG